MLARISECFTEDELFWLRQSVRKELQEMVEFKFMISREKPNHILLGGLDRAANRVMILRSITNCINTLHEILGKLGYEYERDT